MSRVIDFAVSTLAVFLLLPVFLIIGMVIKVDSPGPVFYRARRVGKDGRIFFLYKFRSMAVGADQNGPAITATGDPRITRVGRLLRKTKIDELPQLLNVIKGDMSLVGPRPESPDYVQFYTTTQRRILAVRPGITSAASLRYRHEEMLLTGADWEETYREKVMPDKLQIDLDYEERRTLRSDWTLIFHTLGAMFQSPDSAEKTGRSGISTYSSQSRP